MSRIYNRKAFTGGEMPEALKGTAFMEEAGVDTFIISDLPLTPASGGVLAHVLRADNVAIAIDGTVNASGAAVVVLDADCYHVAGRLSVAIYVTDANEQSQCVYACVGNVWRTTSDTELDSGTVIPTLAQLETAYANCVAAAGNATSAASAAVGNFAPAFDQATANDAGTYVTYTDGKMYYLPSGHTAGTTWANTTKNEVTAGGELADLKGAIEVLEPAATEADVGKALIAKTVADGKVTEYEFGEAGGGADLDSIVTVEQNLTGADSSNRKMLMQKDAPFETELTARDYRRIGYVNVKRGAADITKWVYEDGEIGVDCAFDDLRVDVIAPDKVPAKTVDICLFSGQSNMSGRGTASEATVCPAGEGYWWHNNQFEQIVDPVGFESGSTGDMVPAVCKAYYDVTGVPLVAVMNAIGGTSISQWLSGTYYNNSVNWVNAAKAYAEENGYTVRKIIMLWNQGEEDASLGTTKANYKASFESMASSLQTDAGIELFYIIKIGQYGNNTKDFSTIRAAQDELADENANMIVVSDKFRDAKMYMKDMWHFNQTGLNLVGKDAGINMGYYDITGVKPITPVFNFNDWYDQNVSNVEEVDLTGWSYTTEYGNGLSINKYTGTEKAISIPAQTTIHGYVAPVVLNRVNNEIGFKGNTTIEEVDISEDVKITDGGSSNYQILASMFNGCTALKKVTSLPSMVASATATNRSAENIYKDCSNVTQIVFPNNVASLANCCNGCSSLTEVPEIPDTCTNLQNAFANTKIVTLPDIPDNVITIQGICSGANFDSLTSVGTIGKSVTSMYTSFRYCKNLSGIVRIESQNVSDMGNAFSATAIPNITFQVPANSTTYTTLITAYPNANVTTFTPES